MIIGNHIINNFIRILNKELNQINQNLNYKYWGINPLFIDQRLEIRDQREFYNKLSTVRKSKDDKNNASAENNLNILLKAIENLSEEQKSIIGYTVLSFIIDNTKYINKINLREDQKTYTYLNFTKEFYDEVFSHSVNTLFLPMICRPILWSKENVGGYISELLRGYAYPDQSIVKTHHKLIKQSNITNKQIDCFNYMNNVPFKINKFVLKYVMNEWEKDNSYLFKGYNKLHSKTNEINDNINSELYKEIQAHNSMYYNYYNTIMIATLYRDQIFYLPTFLDFRGRIYSKVSYLRVVIQLDHYYNSIILTLI